MTTLIPEVPLLHFDQQIEVAGIVFVVAVRDGNANRKLERSAITLQVEG